VNEPGIKLTTYFSERQRSGDRFLADALFDLYERHRMRTSVLLRGAVGFGQHHHLHTDRLLTLSETLPAVSIAIDTREKIERALGDVTRVVDHGLITLERARLLTGSGLGEPVALGEDAGRSIKLTLYGGRAARSDGHAGYVAAIELLRELGLAGASVLLGVDGTLHGERRRARFFARNARVPLMLFAVGDDRTLTAALPRLAELVDDPVATIERVQVCKSGGTVFSEPDRVPAEDASGLPIDLKLMVHAREQAKYGRHPLHIELIQRLREAGASGATVLRGVRGFYGDQQPFADRFLSLRRNVPVHVVVVDRPQEIERWWPIVDEVTREEGVVTCEIVPASHVFGAGRERRLQLAATPTVRES
jgi:PII-like signaling protein